ncbi:MAG: cupin domain-containing protein [Desulfitobacterium hafniense]|nr:cupin domain-containing protein [Desulfitobacterium hafniense]
MKRLLTAVELRALVKDGKTVVLPAETILSPSAKDLAKELGINLTIEGSVSHLIDQQPKKEQDSLNSLNSSKKEASPTSDSDIRKVVVKVLGEYLKPACPNPVPTHVKSEKVNIQDFEQAPPGQKIGMVDVVTSREGNLAAGFMTFERSSLPWFLTYDEVDYVVEGEFHLQVDNKLIKAGPGDVIYIPKHSKVVFSSPNFTKVFYVTYPANWAEISGT